MKSLIICLSIHHQNTEKIAKAIAEVLHSELKNPSEVNVEELQFYDLIGFGSGIYMMKHHKTLLDLVDSLPDMNNKKVFVFSTSGSKGGTKFHKALRDKLIQKNCQIVGGFNCQGWDSFGLFKLFGGLNKGRPNDKDLEDAKKFARSLEKI